MRIALALALLATPSLADDLISPALSSFEAGITCRSEPVATEPAPDTIAGFTNIIGEIPDFVSPARVVPGVIGVGFGVKAALAAGDGVPVTITVTHPPMGPDGVTEQSFPSSLGPEVGVAFYDFELSYELVMGDWSITARSGSKVLYVAEFTVVPPGHVPELAGVCRYEALIS